MLRGICKKENFLDLLENFILFDHSGGKTVKILARNHQYLGVNEAVKAYEARKLNNGKLGVFWHTQGSGKSYSMVFLSQKIRRKFAGSPTIVVLTDREELNTQISDTFENCGLLGKTKASKFIATSGEDLINKLKGNPSFIFTLIQKFNKKVDEPIIPDHDIIIMSDEAHRSQYGVFADNMVELLPTASRIGFTGTPLLSNDNITERTFGGYISIYDFKRAVEDKATVPLYYENRGEKILDINNPDITDKILDAIEAADLDPEQEEKLEHEFEKEIHLLTAEPRLKSVARDFVSHYSDLWTSGKAMFVCLNKVTCVRMYDFVQKYWQDYIKTLEKKIQTASQQEVQELERKLNWMKETEMAVVISQEQNEIQTFKKWNLDIKYHREKMEKRELDKEFKDKDNPLRVVFVCAMWLTGFDVKCLSCLYLDKPLKAHTLMQTIARANRVAEGKSNGLIIDYIGIVKALRTSIYMSAIEISCEIDYNGKLFAKIFEQQHTIWNEYVDWVKSKDNMCGDEHKVFELVWRDDKWCEYVEYAFKILIDDNRFFYINEFAGLLFAKTTDATILERNKYYLLEKLRENNSEIEKCKKLIDVVVNILPEWKLEYILEFLKVNKKLEDFKKIDLFPSFCSWSGSEIPLIIEKIDFLKLLKDNLKGIDYIDHRKYIEEYRMDLEKYKEKIELREYIENADYA